MIPRARAMDLIRSVRRRLPPAHLEAAVAVADMRFTPATPKFTTDVITGTVPAGGHAVTSVDNEPEGNIASPSQIGLLLLYRDARREAETIAVSVGGSGS